VQGPREARSQGPTTGGNGRRLGSCSSSFSTYSRVWRVNTSPELRSYCNPTRELRFGDCEPGNRVPTQAREKRTSLWEAGGRGKGTGRSPPPRPVATRWGGRGRPMPSSAPRSYCTVRASPRRARVAASLGLGVRASARRSARNGGLGGYPRVSRVAGKGACRARVLGTIAFGLACGHLWPRVCMPTVRALWRQGRLEPLSLALEGEGDVEARSWWRVGLSMAPDLGLTPPPRPSASPRRSPRRLLSLHAGTTCIELLCGRAAVMPCGRDAVVP
jgi:hypothetical protein